MRSSICLFFIAYGVLAAAFNEDQELWTVIDGLNAELESRNEIETAALEELFETAVIIAFSGDLERQMEDLREVSFDQDDFEIMDRYVDRAAPALTLLNAGESCNVGVNVSFFLEKSAPGSAAYQFFDLASDGFYVDGKSGTAELPVWMEPGESSCQAAMDNEIALLYCGIWSGFRPVFTGYFAEIADETIRGLGGEPELFDEELSDYYFEKH